MLKNRNLDTFIRIKRIFPPKLHHTLNLHQKNRLMGYSAGRAWLRFVLLGLVLWMNMGQARGQNGQSGRITGDFELFQNFFFLDSNILSNPIPPQYYQQLSSTEAWLNMNYRSDDVQAGIRFDMFMNSGLRDPQKAFNNQGVGFWYVRKQLDKLELTAGNIYDQFGSGVTFRAYEARGQNLDYALFGLHARYKLSDEWVVKGFVGRQKFQFDTYKPVLKGLNLEGGMALGNKIQFRPGFSVVNRTLDNSSMQQVVRDIENLPVARRFVPKYNAFAYSAYGSLDAGAFSWSFEAAGKSREAVLNREGSLVNEPGSVLMTGLGYSQQGLGVNVLYKRTSFYEFRVSPLENLNNGLVNFIPPTARMNTYRLTARYAPATQLIGEQGFQADVVLQTGKKSNLLLNGSHVDDLSGQPLFRELYAEYKWKPSRSFQWMLGAQRLTYNQSIYEFKPNAPLVEVFTPFTELTWKRNKKESVRFELSHMNTKQDLGSWWWGLLEYNIAPRYSFSLMDMWNYGNKDPEKRIHYYTVFGAVNLPKFRLTGGYVRQVQGVICTGGVCRVEPAFNGMRFGMSATF
jgi:hypothetical protein